jgi:hypothetical protein
MLKSLLYEIVEEQPPMTVRQLFYRAVSMGLIAKTEAEYKNTVVRLLGEMRLSGDLPFDWIADETRWMRKPRSYDDLEEALRDTAATYRRALWRSQPAYVEVWLEKEALASVIYEVTEAYDVPLMVTRGYASLSFLHAAAEQIAGVGKPTFIYFLGDHDPSGVDIQRTVEDRLRSFLYEEGYLRERERQGVLCHEIPWDHKQEIARRLDSGEDARQVAADYGISTERVRRIWREVRLPISVERLAVTPEQIEAWDLPTRPTKRTDTRSRSFEGASVEVDAIPPDRLRQLVADAIQRHVDPAALEATLAAEESERVVLERIREAMAG